MDERKPLDEGRVGTSKMSYSFVQRSCSLPIIRLRAVPKQSLIYAPCHIRRKLVADRPHRTDDAFRKPAINIPAAISGGLVGEALLTHGPSDMRRERQAQHRGVTMRWMLSDMIFKRRSIGETKVHSRSDVLKLGFRGTQNGPSPLPSSGKVRPRPCRQTTPRGSCVLGGEFRITARMWSNSVATPGSRDEDG